MAEPMAVTPEQEISDGAGRIVAGRFHTLHDAEVVMGRLRDQSLGPQLQERTELPTDQAHLWIWVRAEDLEQARSCMRPGDILGTPRSTPVVAEEPASRKGLRGRLHL
jgi:hypothetical protein